MSSQQKILSGRARCCAQVFLLMHVGNAEQGCDLFRKGLLSEPDPGLWVRPFCATTSIEEQNTGYQTLAALSGSL